jgi:uncharacterized circularly permuted ATP-grasp superfamily protein
MYQDMDDGAAFYRRLLASGATVINTLETEILISKVWFALLWDARYRPLLTREQVGAIERHVPETRCVAPENVDALMRRKDDWVFKTNSGFGGKGVFVGADHEEGELRACIAERGAEQWIAQRLVDHGGLDMPCDATFASERNHLVFGLYVFDGHTSGMMVRAGRRSRVVNVSNGVGAAGWAIAMTLEERARFLSRIRVTQTANTAG